MLRQHWGDLTMLHWPVPPHPARPLHRAELLDLSDDLVVQAGLPRPQGAPHVLWSLGVPVRIGRPRALRPGGVGRRAEGRDRP